MSFWWAVVLLTVFGVQFVSNLQRASRGKSQTETIVEAKGKMRVVVAFSVINPLLLLLWTFDVSFVPVIGTLHTILTSFSPSFSEELLSFIHNLGFLLTWIGAIFFVWSHYDLGSSWDPVITKREVSLMTSGSYQIVRHPMYLGISCIFFGCALRTANYFILLSCGLQAILLPLMRIPQEEQLLGTQFGEKHKEYVKRVKYAFLPGVW